MRIYTNPILHFTEWFNAAKNAGLKEPHAMSLATVSADNKPSVRTVLLKSYNEEGFIFFTNYQSRKAVELSVNPACALMFWWTSLEKQIRIEGIAEKISAQESDAYFKTRPRGSQLGAWASNQSQILPNREFLEKRLQEFTHNFQGQPVPRPHNWGGYRVKPQVIEFWEGRDNRLHERLVYYLNKGIWQTKILSP